MSIARRLAATDTPARRAAATDERVLAAAASMVGLPNVSRSDLARAAGVAPPTAGVSVKRLKAAGRWPFPFPVAGSTKWELPAGFAAHWGHARGEKAVAREPRPAAPSVLVVGDEWNRPLSPHAEACRRLDERRRLRRAAKGVRA